MNPSKPSSKVSNAVAGVPERLWSRSFPAKVAIKNLLSECEKYKISGATQELIYARACMPADLRLAKNMRLFLGLTVLHEVKNVLVEGLLTDERAALSELDSSGMPTGLREVAHGLFNIHERWIVLKALSKSLAIAKSVQGECVDGSTLGEILGESDA